MTGFKGHGEPFYRLSKKLLTADLPALAMELASKEKAIAYGILEKERLEKELGAVSKTLKEDNTKKGYISRGIIIIEKNRIQQKADLLLHEAFLQKKNKNPNE